MPQSVQIAVIVAQPDGTYDIAAVPGDPRQLVNILLSIACKITNSIPIPGDAPLVITPSMDSTLAPGGDENQA